MEYQNTINENAINEINERIVSKIQEIAENIISELKNLEQAGMVFTTYVNADVNGEKRPLYIFRGSIPYPRFHPLLRSGWYVSYYSPMGRVAEKEINSEFEYEVKTKAGKVIININQVKVKVLEKNLFFPEKQDRIWDGIKNQIFLRNGTYSIKSLLQFLTFYKTFIAEKEAIKEVEKIQELEKELLKGFERRAELRRGLRREVIEKIALRDRPTLDQNQGEIFRSPLASQLIITGAPGTGKTTLLIKRIKQKSNEEFLTDQEKAGLDPQQISFFFHEQNWIMFTPTELLKLFLKEAFGKEGFPAFDQTVKIWDSERRIIAKDTLKFLKVGKKGIYVWTSNVLLAIHNNSHLIAYAQEFIRYYNNFILEEFYQTCQLLQTNETTPTLIDKFYEIEQGMVVAQQTNNSEEKVFSLLDRLLKVRDVFYQNSHELDEQLDKIVIHIIKAKSEILQEIYGAIQSYKSLTEQPKEPEEEEEEEIQEEPQTDEFKIIAKRQITQTLTWYAQRIAVKRKISQRNIHATILPIILAFLPDETELFQLGKKIIDRKKTRTLVQGYINILNRIPRYYQKFRLEQLKQEQSFLNKEYEKDIKNKKISAHELDLLILIMLRNARKIFEKKKEFLTGNSKIEILENIKDKYRAQIAVDEATDFSTLQLGCMYYLSHPFYSSVSFAGDLMQRVTSFGLTSWSELDLIGKFEPYEVNIVYRQSPKLLKIAKQLYEKIIGQNALFGSRFYDSTANPYPLQFNSRNNDQYLSQWIAERLVEIHEINNKLPSAAIFVADDEHIDHVVKILEEPLNENGMMIKGCPKGEILGSEGKVRVFSVKYIKGLEFESVFFINIG